MGSSESSMHGMLRLTAIQTTHVVDNHISQLKHGDDTGTNKKTHRTADVTCNDSNICLQNECVIKCVVPNIDIITYQTLNRYSPKSHFLHLAFLLYRLQRSFWLISQFRFAIWQSMNTYIRSLRSFWVWAQPMRHVVTMYHGISLAESIPRIMPGLESIHSYLMPARWAPSFSGIP